MAPEMDRAWLAKVSKRLQGKADRKALPPPHAITAGEILHRCFNQLEGIENGNHLSARTHAIRYRQALLIAFLVCRPVRRRTLLGMNVDTHLRATPEGFHVHFAGEDLKDKKARNFALPKSLVVPMQHYLDTHCPVLMQVTCPPEVPSP
jgi:integrase/recombinase XerD